MENSSDIRAGKHCVFNMHVHLVFVTKYRRKVFQKHTLNSLENIFTKICKRLESNLIEFDGEVDHVHLLLEYPPKLSISRLVNALKGASSRVLKRKHPVIKEDYYKNSLWSPSYFASSCGGAPISIVKKYIEQQKTPCYQKRVTIPLPSGGGYCHAFLISFTSGDTFNQTRPQSSLDSILSRNLNICSDSIGLNIPYNG